MSVRSSTSTTSVARSSPKMRTTTSGTTTAGGKGDEWHDSDRGEVRMQEPSSFLVKIDKQCAANRPYFVPAGQPHYCPSAATRCCALLCCFPTEVRDRAGCVNSIA